MIAKCPKTAVVAVSRKLVLKLVKEHAEMAILSLMAVDWVARAKTDERAELAQEERLLLAVLRKAKLPRHVRVKL